MKKFSEMGITMKELPLVGNKIDINSLLNKEVVVHKYKVSPSKFAKNSEACLWLQVELGGEMRVAFTGSKVLLDTIQQVPEENFPFLTTITKQGKYFIFS